MAKVTSQVDYSGCSPGLRNSALLDLFPGRWRLVEAWERKPISSHRGSCWRRRDNLLYKHPTLYGQAFSSVFQLCFCCFFMFGIPLYTSITTLKAMQKSGHPTVLKWLHTQEFLVKADQAYGRWKSQVMATERPNFCSFHERPFQRISWAIFLHYIWKETGDSRDDLKI